MPASCRLSNERRDRLLGKTAEGSEQLGAKCAIDHAMVAGQRDRHDALEADGAIGLSPPPARRVAPTARMVACGGLMMAENSRTPYMPRLEIADAPPWYSLGFSFLVRARHGQLLHLGRDRRQRLASACRITGAMSPPSIATATPMSECMKRRMRSSAHTAFAAGHALQGHRPKLNDEIVHRQNRKGGGAVLPLGRSGVDFLPQGQRRPIATSAVR